MRHIKCVVVGDGCTGKTALLLVYTEGKPITELGSIPPTIYDNFTGTGSVEGESYTLGLWDTSGNEDFDRLRQLSYPQTDVFLVCFSISRPTSLHNTIEKWVPEIQYNCPGVPFILVGIDRGVKANETITPGNAVNVARTTGAVLYLECSLSTLKGVKEVFDQAAVTGVTSWSQKAKMLDSVLSTRDDGEALLNVVDCGFEISYKNPPAFNENHDKRLQAISVGCRFDSTSQKPMKYCEVWLVSKGNSGLLRHDKVSWKGEALSSLTLNGIHTHQTLSIFLFRQTGSDISKFVSKVLPHICVNTLVIMDAIGSVATPFPHGYNHLETLVVINSQLKQIHPTIFSLPNLKSLILVKADIHVLPAEIEQLSNLERLRLPSNKLRSLPSSIASCKNLRVLDVDDNCLEDLPPVIGECSHLVTLCLRHNKFERIPTSLSMLSGYLKDLWWEGNPLKFPNPEKIRFRSTSETLTFLKAFFNDERVSRKSMKVTIVGQEEAGKTTLLEALKCKKDWRWSGVDSPDKTDGVNVAQFELGKYELTVFDLAGDVEYLKTHSLFLSEDSLFFAVFDMSQFVISRGFRSADQLGRLELWLESIHAQAPGSHVIIVATHADVLGEDVKIIVRQQVSSLLYKFCANHGRDVHNADQCILCERSSGLLSIEEPPSLFLGDKESSSNIQSQLPGTGGILHIMGYFEVGSKEQYPKSLMTSKNNSVERLKDRILRVVDWLFEARFENEIPKKWACVSDRIKEMCEKDATLKQEPVITLERFEELAKTYGMEPDAVSIMLKYFHCQGEFLWYDSISELKNSVILNPKWLSNKLIALISYRPEVKCISDGVLNHQDLAKVWSDTKEETRNAILALLRRAELCFKMSETEEMFPCNLPIGWPDTDMWPVSPAEGEHQLTYEFVFEFLPPSFMADIIVAIHQLRHSFARGVKPLYYRFHAVYFIKFHGYCSLHQSIKSQERINLEEKIASADLHRVHYEVTPYNNTLKVTVRGPLPCCVMNGIKTLVKMLQQSRHKGAEYVEHLMCPECEIRKTKNPAWIDTTEDFDGVCANGHATGSREDLLTGSRRPDPLTSSSISQVGRIIGETLEDHYCPKLFALLPVNTQSLPLKDRLVYTYLRDGYAVHLLCECPGHWHFLDSPGFRISKPREFLKKHGRRACMLLKAISMLEGPLKAASSLDPGAKTGAAIAAASGKVAKAMETLLANYFESFPHLKGCTEGPVEEHLKELKKGSKLQRSELASLLEVATKGRQFGPLVCTHVTKCNEWLWLCEEHNKEYEIVER